MVVEHQQISLMALAEGAAFPITIDPIIANGNPTNANARVESNQVDAHLRESISGAGDVNGDGYSDVIVGANLYDNGQADEGAAFVYYGSINGISTTAVAMVEGNQEYAYLGRGVSGAGDVNGNSYSDVIVGAPFYDNGQTDEGATFIYQGNAGGGLRRNLRLYNTSSNTPIQRSNILVYGFTIGLYGKNPDGRTSGKLVWETRRQGQPFSNTPPTTSTQFTAQQDAYANLGTTGSQFASNVAKAGFATNIRARIRYNPATSQNGEVYSPWVYLQTDFRPRIDATILPLNLLHFTGKPLTQNSALLTWRTSNEVNSSHFELQRSPDSRSFITIATLQAEERHKAKRITAILIQTCNPAPGITAYGCWIKTVRKATVRLSLFPSKGTMPLRCTPCRQKTWYG